MRALYPGVRVRIKSTGHCGYHKTDDKVFVIETVRIADWHTQVTLEGYNRRVNSVCLEIVNEDTNLHQSN